MPRLLAAGADRTRIRQLDGAIGGDGKLLPFSLKHYEALEQDLAANPQTRLVIIDPAGAYIGKAGVDDHKDSELLALLGPLTELAARRRVTIILIKHLVKGTNVKAVHRVSGSTGYVNACRAAFLVMPDNADPDKKLLLPIKFNLGHRPSGLAYRLEGLEEREALELLNPFTDFGDEDRASLGEQLFRIGWEGPVNTDADDMLCAASHAGSKVEKAAAWLRELLCDFAFPSDEIMKAAKSAGYTFDTIKEAKARLKADGLRHRQRGFGDGVWWSGFGEPSE